MKSDLYEAAAKGKIETLNELAKYHDLGSIVTHKKNTLLHFNIIASETRNKEGERVSTEFVKKILEMCPVLLLEPNAKGDAPLHVAARCGQADAVRALIEFARQQSNHDLEIDLESTVRDMLGMTNDEKNTALHEAVQSGSLAVVEILLGADPDFPYSANGSGETPLYMAAARGHNKIVDEILQKCPSAAHEGPDGKTALHAAGCSYPFDAPKLLVDKKKSLTRERDRRGWTPLHYAAYFDHFLIAQLLLEADKSLALIADEDRKMTALHLAAGQGNFMTVLGIIEQCPECCELVDDRGWNVLHFAMVSFDADGLKFLVDKYPVVINLIFEKDVKGNTPFHVLAAVAPQRPQPYNVGYGIFHWKIARGYYQAVNNQNISVEHINRYGFPDLEQEIQELSKTDGSGQYPNGVVKMEKNKKSSEKPYVSKIRKALEYHLVVAALIATVTFAAAFAVPGGYKSDIKDGLNRGTAILSQKAAFRAFVISDAIALVLSLSAVFVYFILSLDFFEKIGFLFVFAFGCTLFAMAAMMIAFVTGTYAMLAPSLGLAIVTCIIGMTFFLLVIFLIYKLISKEFEEESEED